MPVIVVANCGNETGIVTDDFAFNALRKKMGLDGDDVKITPLNKLTRRGEGEAAGYLFNSGKEGVNLLNLLPEGSPENSILGTNAATKITAALSNGIPDDFLHRMENMCGNYDEGQNVFCMRLKPFGVFYRPEDLQEIIKAGFKIVILVDAFPDLTQKGAVVHEEKAETPRMLFANYALRCLEVADGGVYFSNDAARINWEREVNLYKNLNSSAKDEKESTAARTAVKPTTRRPNILRGDSNYRAIDKSRVQSPKEIVASLNRLLAKSYKLNAAGDFVEVSQEERESPLAQEIIAARKTMESGAGDDFSRYLGTDNPDADSAKRVLTWQAQDWCVFPGFYSSQNDQSENRGNLDHTPEGIEVYGRLRNDPGYNKSYLRAFEGYFSACGFNVSSGEQIAARTYDEYKKCWPKNPEPSLFSEYTSETAGLGASDTDAECPYYKLDQEKFEHVLQSFIGMTRGNEELIMTGAHLLLSPLRGPDGREYTAKERQDLWFKNMLKFAQDCGYVDNPLNGYSKVFYDQLQQICDKIDGAEVGAVEFGKEKERQFAIVLAKFEEKKNAAKTAEEEQRRLEFKALKDRVVEEVRSFIINSTAAIERERVRVKFYNAEAQKLVVLAKGKVDGFEGSLAPENKPLAATSRSKAEEVNEAAVEVKQSYDGVEEEVVKAKQLQDEVNAALAILEAEESREDEVRAAIEEINRLKDSASPIIGAARRHGDNAEASFQKAQNAEREIDGLINSAREIIRTRSADAAAAAAAAAAAEAQRRAAEVAAAAAAEKARQDALNTSKQNAQKPIPNIKAKIKDAKTAQQGVDGDDAKSKAAIAEAERRLKEFRTTNPAFDFATLPDADLRNVDDNLAAAKAEAAKVVQNVAAAKVNVDQAKALEGELALASGELAAADNEAKVAAVLVKINGISGKADALEIAAKANAAAAKANLANVLANAKKVTDAVEAALQMPGVKVQPKYLDDKFVAILPDPSLDPRKPGTSIKLSIVVKVTDPHAPEAGKSVREGERRVIKAVYEDPTKPDGMNHDAVVNTLIGIIATVSHILGVTKEEFEQEIGQIMDDGGAANIKIGGNAYARREAPSAISKKMTDFSSSFQKYAFEAGIYKGKDLGIAPKEMPGLRLCDIDKEVLDLVMSKSDEIFFGAPKTTDATLKPYYDQLGKSMTKTAELIPAAILSQSAKDQGQSIRGGNLTGMVK